MLTRAFGIIRFAAGDLLWKVANVIVLAVAARVLPPEQAGLVVLSQTASMILLSLGDLGFRSSGIRLIALDADSAREVIRFVTLRRALSVLVVGLPGALICSALVTDDIQGFMWLALLVLAYLPYFLSADWALLALGNTAQVALARGAYGSVLIILASFAFLFDVALPYFFLVIVVGYCAFAVVSWYYVRIASMPSELCNPKLDIRSALAWSSSLVLASSFALNTLFHSIEVLLAGVIMGEEDSANYAAPFRLVFSIYAVGWVLTQYYSPRFARMFGKNFRGGMRVLLLFLGVGIVGAVATYVLAPWLVTIIYGDAFSEATRILQWLAPTVAMDALVACLGTVLVMQNRGVESTITLAIGCIASILVFIIASDHGIVAAILAKYAAYAGLLLAQLVIILRLNHEVQV